MYFVRIFRFQLQLLFLCQPFQPLNHFRLFTNHLFNQLVQTTSSTFFVYLPNSCVQLANQLLCLCFQKPALISANNFVSSSFFSTIQPSCHQPSPTTPSILFKPPLNPPNPLRPSFNQFCQLLRFFPYTTTSSKFQTSFFLSFYNPFATNN